VCGDAYPVRAANVSGSITFTICGLRGSGLVSMIWMRDEWMPLTALTGAELQAKDERDRVGRRNV
jgi:hypothetical protein